MTLTVPTAGTSGGAAARVRYSDPGGGRMVAEFGQQIEALGKAVEDDALSRQAQRFQTDLTGDMNNLRLEVSQIGDPDQAEAAWQSGTAAIKNKYLTGTHEDGRQRVSEKNRERFGLMFDELNNANSFALGKQVIGQRHAQREATWVEYAHTAVQSASAADPATRAVILGQGYDQIDQMVASGAIDAAEGAKRKIGLTSDVDNARAITMVAEDPDGFIAAADRGEFSGLPAETAARYKVQAQTRIKSESEKAARQAAADKKAHDKEVGDRLQSYRDVRGGGMASTDERWLMSDEAQAHPDYAETMATKSLMDDKPDLAMLTPAQLGELIAAEKSRPVAHKYQTDRLAILQKLKDTAEVELKRDDVAYAREVGLPVAPLGTFDPANPEAYAKGLAQRAMEAETRKEQGYTRKPNLLDKDEADALKEAAAVEKDPASRLALATTVLRSTQRIDPKLPGQLLGDPVLVHVGQMVLGGGNRATAEKILRGQQVIEAGTAAAPSKAERLDPMFRQTADLFAGTPGGEKIQATILEAADAHYAATKRSTDPGDKFDSTAYRQSLHEVMGGRGRFNDKDATGGVQEIRDAITILPGDVSARDAERALDLFGADLAGVRRFANKRAVDLTMQETGGVGAMPSRPLTQLSEEQVKARAVDRIQAASVSGGLPGIGGQPIEADDMDDMQIRAIGPDQYVFDYGGGLVADLTTGKAFVFSLSKFVREYQE